MAKLKSIGKGKGLGLLALLGVAGLGIWYFVTRQNGGNTTASNSGSSATITVWDDKGNIVAGPGKGTNVNGVNGFSPKGMGAYVADAGGGNWGGTVAITNTTWATYGTDTKHVPMAATFAVKGAVNVPGAMYSQTLALGDVSCGAPGSGTETQNVGFTFMPPLTASTNQGVIGVVVTDPAGGSYTAGASFTVPAVLPTYHYGAAVSF